MEKVSLRTRLSYGLGCIGRDMSYTLVNTFILTYLTFAVGLSNSELAVVGAIMLFARVWDAVNDPIMGTIIDNTRTRFGKFKPWIIGGAVVNSIFIILLFTDFGQSGTLFLTVFGITYILWGMTYTVNDISYWSMLPSLTTDQKERERTGSLARIGASIGLFVVTALVPLITQLGNITQMYNIIAIVIAVVFVLCQVLVVVGVKQPQNDITGAQNSVTLKEMRSAIFKNDQLLAVIGCILLFNVGYFTTTGFGLYFFYFDYGVYGGSEYTIFAAVLGVTQIVTLAFYSVFSKHFTRTQLYTIATVLVVIGYVGFMSVGYLLPMSMLWLCISGFFMFCGQAIIQLLVLMLLADTIEYGQWKLGKRTESIIFALNPFVVKLSFALQALVVTGTLIVSGLNPIANEISTLESNSALSKEQVLLQANEVVATVTPDMKLIMRLSMIVLPLLLILCSYFCYRKFYKIDKQFYDRIISELKERR